MESRQTVNGDRSIFNVQKALGNLYPNKEVHLKRTDSPPTPDFRLASAIPPITATGKFDSIRMIVILNDGDGPASNSANEIRSKLADAFDAAGVSAEIVEVDGKQPERLTLRADV
ncbi:MAG: hypothetical protein DME92_09565 [Verrucomicrobia bacterium]|nr:MAG: hypothetical protein DME92_09565 [Verrucomicrobiota bacterium]